MSEQEWSPVERIVRLLEKMKGWDVVDIQEFIGSLEELIEEAEDRVSCDANNYVLHRIKRHEDKYHA